MSSELERLLRDARRVLPDPDGAVTRRARAGAIAAARRRRNLRRPAAALVAAALVALGVAIGALVASEGTAAPAVAGLGFLPEPGWSVVQNGGDGTPLRPALAMAANVPFRPQDYASVLPVSTLAALPPGGVVLIVSFVDLDLFAGTVTAAYYPKRSLPLRVRDAGRYIDFGTQLRPEQPLGEYQLRAAVNGIAVDVHLYFGTQVPSTALLAVAQRQLDRLVVRAPVHAAPGAPSGPASSDRVIDRTLSCSTTSSGRSILRVEATVPGGQADLPGSVELSRGSAGRPESLVYLSSWLDGPTPRPTGWTSFQDSRCRPAAVSIPLTSEGLARPAARVAHGVTCAGSSRVLVRLRAELDRRAVWRGDAGGAVAIGNARRAWVAVQTTAGQPMAFFTLNGDDVRLWSARSCRS